MILLDNNLFHNLGVDSSRYKVHRMKYWLFIFSVIIVSCGGKNHVPNDILKKDSMQAVLKDIMMVDEFVTLYVSKDSTKNEKLERLRRYEEVFALHNTSQNQFKKSLAFYKEKPYMMKEIFDSLSTRPVIKPDAFKGTNHDSIQRIKPDTTHKIRPDSMTIIKLDSLRKFKPDSLLKRKFKPVKK